MKGGGLPHGFGLVVRPPTTEYSGLNSTLVVWVNDPNGRSARLKIARRGHGPVPDVVHQATELRGLINDGKHLVRKVQTQAAIDRNGFIVGETFRVCTFLVDLLRRPRPRTESRSAMTAGGCSRHGT